MHRATQKFAYIIDSAYILHVGNLQKLTIILYHVYPVTIHIDTEAILNSKVTWDTELLQNINLSNYSKLRQKNNKNIHIRSTSIFPPVERRSSTAFEMSAQTNEPARHSLFYRSI